MKALYDVTRSIHLCPSNRNLYLRRGHLLLQLGELQLASFCVRHISTFGEVINCTVHNIAVTKLQLVWLGQQSQMAINVIIFFIVLAELWLKLS